MEKLVISPEKPFKTPEEELSFLRERLSQVEERISNDNNVETPNIETPEDKASVREVIQEYGQQKPEEVLENPLSQEDVEGIVLNLAPEEHDLKMAELLWIIEDKGVRNAMSVVMKMSNHHIEDDFHRFLAEYIQEGHEVNGIKEKTPLWKALNMSLFEVTLPTVSKESREKPLKELLSLTEQFYAGSLSVSGHKEKIRNHFTLEIAVDSNHEHAIFYISVPNDKKDLFEKQLLSIFPQARLVENKNDYNIFNENGESVGSVASFARSSAYPIKNYEDFDHDPLSVTLSAFSKLKHEGEGAAIQITIRPSEDKYYKRFRSALEDLKKGTPAKEALDLPETASGEVVREIKTLFKGSDKKKDGEDNEKQIDDIAVEQVTNKISSPIVETNIRLLSSAPTEGRAEDILHDLEATFNQFEESHGNKINFKRFKKGSKLSSLVRDFSFRLFNQSQILPLNTKELTTIYHFPSSGVESSRELKRSKAGSAPPPIGLSKDGVLLGVNRHRNTETNIYFSNEDRMRHFYTIGQTGTGKTTLLKNMIVQDIKNGEGVCMIDPHGTDIIDVLSLIPEERFDDVIYFDPSNTARPMGLNMLEYDIRFPEQKTFVVNELFSIFQKLYGSVPESMGPMFEQYFRNATMLVIEDPETGNTLLDVSRVLADKKYRELKLSHCNNPIVVQFWREVAEKAGGESALTNIVPYITSKFDVFLANEIMRPIVAQSTSAFNLRRVMDDRKILLVNLAKGRLGDINANLLGLIIVGKILMAALSRVDSIGKDIPNFYLYIDEFQNVTTNSIATILSEARKYRLSLNIAHQFIAQLDDGTKNAVFGNVGSMCTFRVGADDAGYLESQFQPSFTSDDLMNVDNFKGFLKLLVDGRPVTPFDIETVMPDKGDPAIAEKIKALSFEKYGKQREEIEREVSERYRS